MNNECKLQEEARERLKIITNNELKAKIKLNFGKIIDVRSKDQFDAKHIEGAISIPLNQLKDNLDKFDKKEELNIICNVGEKARKAADILMDNDFEMVSIVLPGMSKWEKDDLC